jgi:hypothetical protein
VVRRLGLGPDEPTDTFRRPKIPAVRSLSQQ